MMILSVVKEARLELQAMARAAVDATDPTAQYVPVHAYPPAQLVTPAVFIDMPRISPGFSGLLGTIGAQFPIVMAYDGASQTQCEDMDVMAAVLWDAFNQSDGMTIESADPDPIEIGGPSTRSLVFVVTVDLGVTTLCKTTSTLTA